MTKEAYNWSDLLDKYRGRSLENKSKLKRWSEMCKADSSGSRVHRRSAKPLNPTEVILEDDMRNRNRQEELIELAVENLKPSKSILVVPNEDGTVRSKIKTVEQNDSELTEQKPIDNVDKATNGVKNITSEELLYDTLMQDKDTIPNLHEKQQLFIKGKQAERDHLLIDLLELNTQLNP